MSQRIFLDYIVTTPLPEGVQAELARWLQLELSKSSSQYWAGKSATIPIKLPGFRLATLIGRVATKIIFASANSEANHHAIKGMFFECFQKLKQPHDVISTIGHPAVTTSKCFLGTPEARVTFLPVDLYGLVITVLRRLCLNFHGKH